jgi:hypothetical protein
MRLCRTNHLRLFMTILRAGSIKFSLQFLLVAIIALGCATVPAFAEDPPAATTPTWTVPADWAKQAGERAMRIATFTAGADATAMEVAISSFPGDAGGLFANVNRWRGQVGLPAVTKDDLMEGIATFENPGMQIFTMRLKGAANQMLGGIVYDEANDRTWFIKATAGAAAVEQHEKSFVAFAQSFKAPKK